MNGIEIYLKLIDTLLESTERRTEKGWIGSHCYMWDCQIPDCSAITLRCRDTASDDDVFSRIDIEYNRIEFWTRNNFVRFYINRNITEEELFQQSLIDDTKGLTIDNIVKLYEFFEEMVSYQRRSDV